MCVMVGARKIQEFISAAAASDVKSGTFDTVRWPRTRTTKAAAATAHTHRRSLHERCSMLGGYWIKYSILKYNNILLTSAGSFRNIEYRSRGVKYYSFFIVFFIYLTRCILFHRKIHCFSSPE